MEQSRIRFFSRRHSWGTTVSLRIHYLNDVYLGDNVYIENCIVESRDTIRANTRYVGENGVRVVVEKNERYAL